MRHFDVQIMGGQVLYEGRIAEMKTGEGKTLVATLPVYARALEGRGVHVVTVNDYLARRDAEWMGPVYEFLGLSVGVIQHGLDSAQRREAYNCDVTYVTNNEVGFDYLRDNMAWQVEDLVQRELYFALVDEVDSILVDEARTPLIISGPSQESGELYDKFAQIVPRLKKGEDFTVDEKAHAVPITEAGVAKVEKMLGVQNLYEQRNIELTHQLNAALKAWNLFHAISSTSSKTARSSSSMSSPDGLCTAGATPTASIRRSKQRKASRFAARIRRSRRSPSRTFSGSTITSPA